MTSGGKGTNPDFGTKLTTIQFYSGVQLDPLEENIYIPRPQDVNLPTGITLAELIDPNTGQYISSRPISDWWTREEFEATVLSGHERTELALSPNNPDLADNGWSYYTSKDTNIISPYPLTRFQYTNVNFLKITNTVVDPLILDENGDPAEIEMIYYGFINNANYINDGATAIDWTPSEFYNNIWNSKNSLIKNEKGLTFANSSIRKAHYMLENHSGLITSDFQYQLEEDLSAGKVLLTDTNEPEVLKQDDIMWCIIPCNVGQNNPANRVVNNNIGYPDQSSFLVLPFNPTTTLLYDLVAYTKYGDPSSQKTYSFVSKATGKRMNLSQMLLWLFADGTATILKDDTIEGGGPNTGHKNDNVTGLAINADNVTVSDYIGFHYSLSGNTISVPVDAATFGGHYFIDGTIFNVDVGGSSASMSFLNNQSGVAAPTGPGGPGDYYYIPQLFQVSTSQQYVADISQGKSLYQFLKTSIQNFLALEQDDWVNQFFNTHGGFPEKLTHYIGINYIGYDQSLGSFTANESSSSVNNPIHSYLFGSPYEAVRHDVVISPLINVPEPNTLNPIKQPDAQTLLKKFVFNAPAAIVTASNNWITYEFLNKNSMAQQQAAITTQEGITKQQNKFNQDQTHYQTYRNWGYTHQLMGQNSQMTKQTAMQTQGMQQFQAGVAAGFGANDNLGQAINAYNQGGGGKGGAFSAAASFLGGGAKTAGGLAADWKGADMQFQNTMANMQLQNTFSNLNVGWQNATANQLAANSRTFADSIAGQTAALQEANLHAGWNDVKAQPGQTLSGGSMMEYGAQQQWFKIHQILSYPQPVQCYHIGRIMLEQGVNIADFANPTKYFFTRKVMNYIQCDIAKINPVSYMENSVRTALEAMFMRGVKIWHNVNAMAANDYTGNDYSV